MNLISTEPDDPTSLQNFDQILKTYKKLNGIINSYDSWEKSIVEKENKLKRSLEDNDNKNKKYEKDLGQYLDQIRTLEASVQSAVKSFAVQQDDLKRRELELAKAAETLIAREKELAHIEENVKMREMDLVDREDYVIARERELQEKEDLLKNLEQDIINVSTKRFNNLNFERGESIEVVGKSEEILTFRDEKSFENEEHDRSPSRSSIHHSSHDDHQLAKKIKKLEEENSILNRKNKAVEEEIKRSNQDITATRLTLEKEKENLLHKEESLKAKEHGLKKRESELVEKTKFVNSMILAVNQQLKHLKSKDSNNLTESSQNNLMSVREQKHIMDTKPDIANYSSLFYGNEEDNEKENGYSESVPAYKRYGHSQHGKHIGGSRDHDQTQSFEEMM